MPPAVNQENQEDQTSPVPSLPAPPVQEEFKVPPLINEVRAKQRAATKEREKQANLKHHANK